ncbi:26S proteasome regulatory subunit 10B [Aphelenchoides fujianensis]|nr:26S proteasome regulatory subunit 10B [Aphelenchoides fujianensis]
MSEVRQPTVDDERSRQLAAYRRKLADYKEVEAKLKELRKKETEMQKDHDKSENDIKSLQSVGQIVGEVLKQLTEEKFIELLKQGTRVALDMTTLTIMRQLPREVDPLVYKMSHEDPGNISYAEVGGLAEQIRELREVVELPLLNPDLFKRLDCNFLKVVSSAIVDKYIGESARMIREMFNYARDHQPCIVFMFAGLFAIRAERDYVVDEDFMKAVRKVADAKRLESKLDYKPV